MTAAVVNNVASNVGVAAKAGSNVAKPASGFDVISFLRKKIDIPKNLIWKNNDIYVPPSAAVKTAETVVKASDNLPVNGAGAAFKTTETVVKSSDDLPVNVASAAVKTTEASNTFTGRFRTIFGNLFNRSSAKTASVTAEAASNTAKTAVKVSDNVTDAVSGVGKVVDNTPKTLAGRLRTGAGAISKYLPAVMVGGIATLTATQLINAYKENPEDAKKMMQDEINNTEYEITKIVNYPDGNSEIHFKPGVVLCKDVDKITIINTETDPDINKEYIVKQSLQAGIVVIATGVIVNIIKYGNLSIKTDFGCDSSNEMFEEPQLVNFYSEKEQMGQEFYNEPEETNNSMIFIIMGVILLALLFLYIMFK